jgi:hypothetical protein
MMTSAARRLVAAATAAMPPSRRDWGRAIAAEIDHADSRAGQVRLVLAAIRLALLPPLVAGENGRAAGRSAVFAAYAFVPLGAGLYVFNVVVRSGQDPLAGVLAMDGYLLLILLTAGALARRASSRISTVVSAGMAAGAVLAVLGMATFAWLDNAFFSVISQQQETIDNFRDSGMTSMHAYLNSGLESATPGVVIFLALIGALVARIGAALYATATEARPRLHHLPRRQLKPLRRNWFIDLTSCAMMMFPQLRLPR